MKEEKNLINFDYELRFNGVNYYTAVWINGVYLGHHFGGFTPFNFNVNKLIKKNKNLIAIRVDNNRKSYRIPSLSFDWFNWGGIYRDVDLLILEKNRINDIIIRTKLITRQESRIEISYKVIGSLTLKWQILDDSQNQILFEGVIDEKSIANSFNVSILNPKLWSPDTPYLYYLRIYDFSLKSRGKINYNTYFGIREIKINGIYLYLNKKKIFLKGVNLHEEYMPYGRTIPYEKRKEDVENIKKLGLNAIRTAHYSHDESLIEIADKLGILILEEIPVYQHCEFNNPFTLNIASNMLKELIMRDINHPSVIWWSVGNEVPLHKRECAKFIKNLVNLARELDNSRIITCVSRKLISDLTRKSLEVVTINTYFGWYYGHERMISLILDPY